MCAVYGKPERGDLWPAALTAFACLFFPQFLTSGVRSGWEKAPDNLLVED
jgi:hypothetical protein